MRPLKHLIYVSASLLLIGCGGGGGGSSSTTSSVDYGYITGTVAIGAALSSVAVTITDSKGTTLSATTNSSGVYSVKNTGLVPPILAKVTPSSGSYNTLISSATSLYSSTSSTSDTVNITPATTSIVGAALSKSPSAVSHNDTANLSSSDVTTASTKLNNLLQDINSLAASASSVDFISSSFTANSTGVDAIYDAFLFSNSSNTISVTSQEGFKNSASSTGSKYALTAYDWLKIKGEKIKSFVASAYHECAIVTSGKLYCWNQSYGSNSSGVVGNGTVTNQLLPVQIGVWTNVKDVQTTDAGFTCALLTTGSVYCWGTTGSQGQLGTPTGGGTVYSSPQLLTFISSASAIGLTDSGENCAVLTSDGTLKCWGDNGNPTAITLADLGSSVKQFSGGGTSSCALLTNGAVKCFGWNNSNGEYGNLVTTPLSNGSGRVISTVQLKVGTVTQVASGTYFACALFDDGTVQCWGQNNVGQLGNGTVTNSTTPVNVSFSKKATSLTASYTHACALLEDGVVKCWGRNDYGQLGATTTQFAANDGNQSGSGPFYAVSSVPITATSLTSSASNISVTYYGTCVVTTDSHFQCWGSPANSHLTSSASTF